MATSASLFIEALSNLYIVPEDARGAAPPRTPQGNAFFTVEVCFQTSQAQLNMRKAKIWYLNVLIMRPWHLLMVLLCSEEADDRQAISMPNAATGGHTKEVAVFNLLGCAAASSLLLQQQ